MLSVRGLTTEYAGRGGSVRAVTDVSFDVSRGRFFTLLGPSGCGKTTTLRSIAGLERPTSGEIRVGNDVVFSRRVFVPPNRRGLGMVFQDLALFPHMTVFENIGFGLRVKKVPEREIRERVTAAAAAMHIEPLLNKLPRECSGGESHDR